MNRRVVRAMLATLAVAAALAVSVPSAVAQWGPDLAVTVTAPGHSQSPACAW